MTNRLRRTRTVHPRARGEHIVTAAPRGLRFGSSPRPRGTQDVGILFAGCVRFIPAPAGNTRRTRISAHARPVHPRARGEHSGGACLSRTSPGSSPRPRGTQPPDPVEGAPDRFIPAPAGNTLLGGREGQQAPVHPRARGEHYATTSNAAARCGSSPRPRGTLYQAEPPAVASRFIPAPAGNTARCWWKSPPPAVHPRARGEHTCTVTLGVLAYGSSPRPRGTRHAYPWVGWEERFIPAPAGNTYPHEEAT